MADDNDARNNLRSFASQLLKATGARLKQWQQGLAGLVDGTLGGGAGGSTEEPPAWLTLDERRDVPASDRLAAGGRLQPHEHATLASIREPGDAPERTTLNLHFLAGPGRAALDRMLEDGTYRISVPEESALLAAAWLHRRGESDRSASLIATLAPFFDRVRFYPAPHPEPLSVGSGVHAQTAGVVAAALAAKRPQRQLERMRESIAIWTPLYDRAIGLFLETVEGESPTLRRTAAGELQRGPSGNPIVIGGWPCRRYSPDWPGRARAWLDECRSLRATHTLCGKPDDPKANFARLRHYLERCATDPGALGPRDVGMIRRILGTFVGRHGAPDSVRRLAARSTQRHTVSAPAHAALARQVAARLHGYPPYAGVADLERVLAQLTAARPLPASIERKARRCLEAPLPELVSRGVITSSRELAQLLPLAAARDRAKAIEDPALRRLFEACHIAFRSERARATHFGELPWIDALTPWVGSDAESRAAARATSVEVLAAVLSAFPHEPLPNELVRELRALTVSAGLALPLVDATRAASFPGDFAEAYARAGERASHFLHGTLYARYYDLPGPSPAASDWAALCHERARRVLPNASESALEGALLEQAQILTTRNLAPLFEELELAAQLRLPELARTTFDWIGRELQRPLKDWRAQQQVQLDTAAAWRQLIFYLSLLSRDELEAFLGWTEQSSARRKPRFRERVAPVLAGLRAIAAGGLFDAHGLHEPSGGRRFVGWTEGTHWLLRPRGGAASRAKR